jgi:hypothetical protein
MGGRLARNVADAQILATVVTTENVHEIVAVRGSAGDYHEAERGFKEYLGIRH